MKSEKPMSEKECYAELIKYSRLFCDYKNNKEDYKYIKYGMKQVLSRLGDISHEKEFKKAEKERIRYCKKYGVEE